MPEMDAAGADQEDIGQRTRQVDAILAKFPGPVTLHVTLTRQLLGLVIGVCGTALCVWFWISPHRYRWYYLIMQPVGTLFFAGLTVRAVILLILPRHAESDTRCRRLHDQPCPPLRPPVVARRERLQRRDETRLAVRPASIGDVRRAQ